MSNVLVGSSIVQWMTINEGVEREAEKSFKGHQKVGGISFFIFGWSPTIMQISLQEKILNDVSFFPVEQGGVKLNARIFFNYPSSHFQHDGGNSRHFRVSLSLSPIFRN